MSEEIELVTVSSQPIELYKVLKIANMVSGGGEAKIVISEGYVYLNGELEYQKRKKVYQDDYIEFNGEVVQVNVVEETTPINSIVPKKKAKNSKNKKAKTQVPSTETELAQTDTPAPRKRKPIAF